MVFVPSLSPIFYAFGLAIESDWDLPCSTAAQVVFAKLRFRQGTENFFYEKVGADHWQPGPKVRLRHLEDGSVYLGWKTSFEFHLSADGSVITARNQDGDPEAAFRTYMLGHVLSHALLLMGVETIHAATIVMNGEGVAFLGDSAFGKSTLTAAFLQAGCKLLSDDFMVIRPASNGYLVYPGFPRIKLYERVATKLLSRTDHGVPMNQDHCPKMAYLLRDEAHAEPVPLRAFYALASPQAVSGLKDVSIEAFSDREAYLELTRNSFNVKVTHEKRLSAQFEWATKLARNLGVRRLAYPRVLTILPKVVEAVRYDLASQPARNFSKLPMKRADRSG